MSGYRNKAAYIVVVAYGRRFGRMATHLDFDLDVEWSRDDEDKRRRDHRADWCFLPPTWKYWRES